MSALFQTEISTISSQIAQLQSQLASLNKAEFVADGILQAVASGIEELSTLRADAVTRLREAVLSLFKGDDNGNDSGNRFHPNPAPQPNNDGGCETVYESEQKEVSLITVISDDGGSESGSLNPTVNVVDAIAGENGENVYERLVTFRPLSKIEVEPVPEKVAQLYGNGSDR